MNRLLFVTVIYFASFFISNSMMAAENNTPVTYHGIKLTVQLNINEVRSADATMISLLNENITIIREDSGRNQEVILEILPTLAGVSSRDHRTEMIHLSCKIGIRKLLNPEIKWIASPEILTLDHQQADLIISSEDPNDEFKNIELKVFSQLF